MENNYFSLGTVMVSPSHNELSTPDRKVKLQPKAIAVLLYLADHYERVVSNEELIERVWEGRVVTHGSVQKSINALRTAFNDLIGEQEIIAHYSKRGYQLTIAPVFTAATQVDTDLSAPSASQGFAAQPAVSDPTFFDATIAEPVISEHAISEPAVSRRFPQRTWIAIVGFLAALTTLGLFILLKPSLGFGNKSHKTTFQTHVGYTNETGHERNAVPHPDNLHVAYIREKFNVTRQGETDSQILVRDNTGKDWPVAKSQGSWFKLAWSPSGQRLVAIEIKRDEGLPLNPNFYEKPNYLYTFHIFTLDLTHRQLLEKQLLSQWQGRIFSVTWWDEDTLDFVAQQGTSSSNTRYRYSTLDQRLTPLDEIDGITYPVASVVLNKNTALISQHKNTTQVDFLNEQQRSTSRFQLAFSVTEMSWIPDGSGLLLYAANERKLVAFYRDGTRQPIPFVDAKDSLFSRPRYSADGQGIYYTEEKLSVNILRADAAGNKLPVTENNNLNYGAVFSASGDEVVYASVRNNETHLWLISDGQERQLTKTPLTQRVNSIIWADDDSLVFSTGNAIYRHPISTDETQLVLNDSAKMDPLAFTGKTLTLLKTTGDTRNLWRVDTQTHDEKQLTFGAVGSAIGYRGDIYFQYIGEQGLRVLRKDNTLETLNTHLAENSKLLRVDEKGIYWIGGGLCHESDIQFVDFTTKAASTVLTRNSNAVSTSSFHPNKGVLETECYLPESNIVLMK